MFGNCILLLCGLPASGKSVLVRDLIKFVSSKSWDQDSERSQCHETCNRPCIISVLYDQLIPLDVQKEMVKISDEWKKARQEIVSATETLLRKRMNPCETKGADTGHLYDRLCTSNRHATDCPPCQKYLVLVEDNFYYSSMRYSWHQLARKLSAGFCQVWLHCPVPELTRRNSERQCSIPAEVIRVMAGRQERPDPVKNSWELRSLIVDTAAESDTERTLRNVWDLVMSASSNPEKPVVPPEHDKEPCDVSPNDINIADQILRKIVSSKVKEARGGSVDLATYARQLNLSRAAVLDSLRSGTVRIPPSLGDDAEGLEQFVLRRFVSR